jgi:hypothetical protein
MSTGIFFSNFIFIDSLKKFLTHRKNHLQLIFPYLDYGLNYKSAQKNQIEKYESLIEHKDIELQVGGIIPNYKINNSNICLRELLKNIQQEEKSPIFFILFKNNEILSDLNKIKLFDEKLPITNFQTKLIENNIKFKMNQLTSLVEKKLYIEELESYNLVIIRPDFIIEYLNK